jgi:asparagine synthase (glutamine-hydrolysing)
MCGITGIYKSKGAPVEISELKGMTDAIAHRGPDGQGHWAKGHIGFGHVRLAIIDLSISAAQPMATTDEQSILVFNGEIYNFKELRAELSNLGRTFRTLSDTEVVLQALAQWGTKALLKFNGMFALAWWDSANETLLLARDRYGIKPLYYGIQGDQLAFGSEQKAIFSQAKFKKSLNRAALLEYFTFQNIFTDSTLLEGVSLLPAGCFLSITSRNSTLVCKQTLYWDFNFAEPAEKKSDEEYREELDRLFQQAVKRQMQADVEVGCYLSGGIDSGSIAAVASKCSPYLKTFTCGFDLSSASGLELAFDERAKAEQMSYHFKTEQYEMVLKAGDMERALPNLAWHLEEPRVGQSYPNYYAAKLASKFVKVVLSGAGGDELFGGYPWRYYSTQSNDSFTQYIDKYYAYWQRLLPNGLINKVFAPVHQSIAGVDTKDIFRSVFHSHAEQLTTPEDYINHSLYFEAKTFLHGLLVVEDKISMAHGLESRVPFLDNDLVDFAMACPVRLKINQPTRQVRINENEIGDKSAKYFNETKDGKLILRSVMQRHLPASIVSAGKQGFSAPDASWFKGESIDFVKTTLMQKDARIYEVLDRTTIHALINEHLTGVTNRRLLIWSLLNVESWLGQVGCSL